MRTTGDATAPMFMTLRQWLIVALCVAINIVDGFEILIAGYTAPAISREFALDPALTGLFLSASPSGMVVGALFVSPIADLLGRRQLVMLCLIVCILGMAMIAFSHSLPIAFLARLVTGIGVGAMMVGVNTVAAEAASPKRRDLALVLQATGFPLGGALCGLAASLTAPQDWRWIYGMGAVGAFVLLIAVVAWLPARKAGEAAARPPLRYAAGALATRRSLMISASFFCMMMSFYFLTSWAPKLIASVGNLDLALSGAAMVSVGGVVGDLAFAALMLRWPARRIGPVFAACAFVSALALAASGQHVATVWAIAMLVGFFLYGAMASHYAVVAGVYPQAVRASGSGLAIGVGRIGAAAGPAAGGLLLANGSSPFTTTAILAMPLLCCMILVNLAAGQRHGSDGSATI